MMRLTHEDRNLPITLGPPRWHGPAAMIARIAAYGLALAMLYAVSPDAIGDTPLAALTLNKIITTAFFAGAATLLVYWLFHPSADPDTKARWANLGLILLVLGGIGALLLAAAWHNGTL